MKDPIIRSHSAIRFTQLQLIHYYCCCHHHHFKWFQFQELYGILWRWFQNTGFLCKVSEGFLRTIFKLSTNFIQFLFSKHLTLWFFCPVKSLIYLQFYRQFPYVEYTGIFSLHFLWNHLPHEYCTWMAVSVVYPTHDTSTQKSKTAERMTTYRTGQVQEGVLKQHEA